MSGKYALIIGNTEYIDSGLAQLSAPGKDAEDFGRVLKNPEIGAFDNVKVIVNEPSASVIEAIDEFFDQKKPDDMLVLYFSGHGIRDEIGSLYLAFKNTIRSRLRSTAIKSDYVKEAMDQSRSKRQVLILDCCNSGAFPQGTKAELGGSMGMTKAFQGYGRFVLTASDATQFAWEGNKVIGETENSLFTHFLVKGLEGEADNDGDGRITVDELYEYAYDQILRVTPKQTPTKSSSKVEGEIVLRQSTRIEDIKPIPLPDELIDEVEDTRPYVREAAVQKLGKILKGKNIGMARSAIEALEKIVNDENTTRRVSQVATQVLESYKQTLQKADEERLIKLEAERLSDEKRLASEQAEVEQKAKEETERLAQQKADEERIAKAKLQAERLAEEKRLAAEKAEAERLAKLEAEQKAREETERLAQQKADEERITKAKLQAERLAEEKRLAAEKAEAEKLAKHRAEEERIAKAKIEAERLAKEKRLAAEKAEAERKTREGANRLATQKVEEERIAKAKIETERLAQKKHPPIEKAKNGEDAGYKVEPLTLKNHTAFATIPQLNPNIILRYWPAAVGVLALVMVIVLFQNLPGGTTIDTPQSTDIPANSLTPALTTIATSELSLGSRQFSPKDGMKMVFVPAGKFTMGSDSGNSNEQPIHIANLDSFWIDQTEITNEMYSICVQNGACNEPSDTTYYSDSANANHPIVYVNWQDAQNYCAWADRRLPSEAEWEKAARGTDGRSHPWGEEFGCYGNFKLWQVQNNKNGGYEIPCTSGSVSKVGDFPEGASPFGALDMAGNAWEWVADWYDMTYYNISPSNNPQGPDSGTSRVIRGGDYDNDFSDVRSAYRSSYNPELGGPNLGFRCVTSNVP